MNSWLAFSKMQGLGNDFVVIDAVSHPVALNHHIIRRLANRRTGVGFDQCLVLEPPRDDHHDFFYRIFNADGSEVGQCGNGARCLGIFIKQKQLAAGTTYRIQTLTTSMQITVIDEMLVSVTFEPPRFDPSAIPLNVSHQSDYYQLDLSDQTVYLHAVSVGNPHGIIVTNTIPAITIIDRLGHALSSHEIFEKGANISWVNIHSPSEVNIVTFERGCGRTLACGSAAIAAASCVHAFHQGAKTIKVKMLGGEINVEWQDVSQPITATGAATTVFEGRIRL